MINHLPEPIIETILSLLPTKEAARTSILSKEWKHHWTKIPNLAFIEEAVKPSRDADDNGLKKRSTTEKLKLINHVISMHQGPIHEFSLSMHATGNGPCVELNHIIDNLSRYNNTLTKLTLDMCGYYSLPESLFLLHKLTYLYRHCCRLDVLPTFSGFGSLTYLRLGNVRIAKRMLIRFLSTCPLLKIVTLNAHVFGSLPTIDEFILIELFGCLPVVENLSICLKLMTNFAQGRVPKKLPVPLVHLKYLCIRDTCIPNQGDRIPCHLFLLRSCPNLEKLKLKIFHSLRFESWTDRSDMWFEHLNELEIEIWTERHFIMDMLPHVLVRSPVLKKVKVLHYYKVSKDEELKMLRRYSAYKHASPVVEIVVKSGVRFSIDRF